jgi:predicted ATP-binding protein involved in virulence
MKISQLTLTHYRGASSLPLILHPRLNIFVGMNGAGKSSVLDAAAILLSWMVNRIKRASASGRPIAEQDIYNGEASANLEITCQFAGNYFGWNLTKTRKGHNNREFGSILVALAEVATRLRSEISETNAQLNLPLFAYYPVNRAVLDIPLRIRERHSFDLLSAYDESLTSGASFRRFFEWFREREDLENENRKYVDDLLKPEGFQFPDPHLEAVRRALAQFMPEFSQLTVRRSPLRMEVQKRGRRLTVNQLSDGEKCLMAMIGDLARRLAIANPLRENPLEGEAVVLIDEIDLHLHPSWQRMVVPRLMSVFPNCQFLISTHSPHVITHAQPEHLFLLSVTDEGIVAGQPNESYGKTVDRVLEDLMGLETTRPDPVATDLGRIYDAINGGRMDAAKELIEDVKSRIGEDPALVRASVLIKRKALIGK